MRLLALVLIALVMVGCGGSGNDAASSFAGRFAGEWQIMPSISGGEPLDGGVIDMQIPEKGQISGSFSGTSPSQQGTLSGRIRSNGDLSFNVSFESGGTQYLGNARLEGNRLTGYFAEPGVGYINMPGFNLERQP